jgi:uncharacterized protein (DUF488 family)
VNLRECHLDRNPWNSSLWLGVEPAAGGRISISSSCPAQFVMTRHPLPQVSQWSPGTIFTIGHSTLSIERFIALVHAYGIERLADVRTVPRSRHNPQFNSDKLGPSLKQENIDYVPLQSLGGLRHPRKDSPNAGWRNESFRGFADYMQTEGFQEGLQTLITMSRDTRTAIMCAEAVPWRCHRSLVADAISVRGIPVIEILSENDYRAHKLTPFARLEGTAITYPPEQGALL